PEIDPQLANPRALTRRERRFLKPKLGVFCLSSVNRFIVLPFVVIIGFPFTERFQSASCMDRQTLRWLAFSLGVDAADADQDQRNEQKSIISCSQLSSFCF